MSRGRLRHLQREDRDPNARSCMLAGPCDLRKPPDRLRSPTACGNGRVNWSSDQAARAAGRRASRSTPPPLSVDAVPRRPARATARARVRGHASAAAGAWSTGACIASWLRGDCHSPPAPFSVDAVPRRWDRASVCVRGHALRRCGRLEYRRVHRVPASRRSPVSAGASARSRRGGGAETAPCPRRLRERPGTTRVALPAGRRGCGGRRVRQATPAGWGSGRRLAERACWGRL
jgi:hypothetical protein